MHRVQMTTLLYNNEKEDPGSSDIILLDASIDENKSSGEEDAGYNDWVEREGDSKLDSASDIYRTDN